MGIKKAACFLKASGRKMKGKLWRVIVAIMPKPNIMDVFFTLRDLRNVPLARCASVKVDAFHIKVPCFNPMLDPVVHCNSLLCALVGALTVVVACLKDTHK